ncbi:MAG: FtsX-like permease family protein [Methanobacteriota archaeon]|nr:MAG: FtsX-like permease family protein [Euryarchaeota archaeon]
MLSIIRRRAVVVVALAITIFTATTSILSELQSVPAAFAGSGDYIIHANDSPTIFSSRVDVGLVPLLLSQENISDAWAEIVTFSASGSQSFVVRGMNLDSVKSAERFAIDLRSELGDRFDPSDGIVGSRLMHALDIVPPCIIPVSGSYTTRVEFVEVVGSFETGTYLDDELVVSEQVARYLSGMPPGMASLIAVETDDPEWLGEVLSSDSAHFALSNVEVSKTAVVAIEEVMVTMEAHNWGSVADDATICISVNGILTDELTVAIDPTSVIAIMRPVILEQLGTHSIEVWVSGSFSSRTTLNVTVVDPYLTLAAPSTAFLGSQFEISVFDCYGAPVSGAEVSFEVDDERGSVITDDDGVVAILVSRTGSCFLNASYVDYDDASAVVQIVDLGLYPDEFLPRVVSFVLSDDSVSESDEVKGVIVVENTGAVEGLFYLPVLMDSSTKMLLNISLEPAERRSVTIAISDIAVGTHTIQVGAFAHELTVEPWFADESDLVQLMLRYGGTGALSSGASVPIYQAAQISEGNVAVALFSVGAISAVLATLAISATFAKEVREGRRTLGILRTIGASNGRIRRIVLPQALFSGAIGAVIGIIAGITVTYALTRAGAFIAFGHALVFEPDVYVLALITGWTAVISVASSLASAEVAVRESPLSSIRNLDGRNSIEADESRGSPIDE